MWYTNSLLAALLPTIIRVFPRSKDLEVRAGKEAVV